MQENHLFEYAVVRIVPRVEREEFLNVGVILYCAKQKFLQAEFRVNEKRIKNLCAEINVEEVIEHLTTFEKICRGKVEGGPIGKLPIAERFRWLTATRSTTLPNFKGASGLYKRRRKDVAKIIKPVGLVTGSCHYKEKMDG